MREPTAEDLELLLIHEEPRKAMGTGHPRYFGQFSPVLDHTIGRRVWTILQGEALRMACGREEIAPYQLRTDYLQGFPQDS